MLISKAIGRLSALIVLSSGLVHATPKNEPSVQLRESTIPVTIDGVFDPAEWRDAEQRAVNNVTSPWENKPSPVDTQVWLKNDAHYLYVAFIASDPNPSAIQGFLGEHDSRWADDLVGIKLDPYHTGRSSYDFFVNPYGVKLDAMSNELTQSQNRSWDAIWDAKTQITDTGYVVEMAIPFGVLAFEGSGLPKTWGFELARVYQRGERLRISNVQISRDDPCLTCQMADIQGFSSAQSREDRTLTPSLSSSRTQRRDVYNPPSPWSSENDVEAGLDVHWGLSPNTQLDLTVNPDFSTVESDAVQLGINKTYSLFYAEKRAFFLANSEYFTSPTDLVYTRNIADPNVGVKLTHRSGAHTSAAFFTDDQQTVLITPGNLGSSLMKLPGSSRAGALRYRYDHDKQTSLGLISTVRQGKDYDNVTAGLDGRYRLDDSNTVTGQWLYSTQQLPGKKTELEDQLLTLAFDHSSEYWDFSLSHLSVGEDFRADLGYVPQVDVKETSASLARTYYLPGDFYQGSVYAYVSHLSDQQGRLLANEQMIGASLYGSKQFAIDLSYNQADRIGSVPNGGHLEGDLAHYARFDEAYWAISTSIQPLPILSLSLWGEWGDKMDHDNNRLGQLSEWGPSAEWAVSRHLTLKYSYIWSEMDVQGKMAYRAELSDLRVNYQFNVNSYLKLSLIHSDYHYNVDNNPLLGLSGSGNERSLATQLLYAYEINPRTVFFLGYSDGRLRDDDIRRLTVSERTMFTKVSYAW